MAKWTAKQFGVSANGVSKINGSDTVTNTTASTMATQAASYKPDSSSEMANSLATQSGQTTMGNSRATSGGSDSSSSKNGY